MNENISNFLKSTISKYTLRLMKYDTFEWHKLVMKKIYDCTGYLDY